MILLRLAVFFSLLLSSLAEAESRCGGTGDWRSGLIPDLMCLNPDS